MQDVPLDETIGEHLAVEDVPCVESAVVELMAADYSQYGAASVIGRGGGLSASAVCLGRRRRAS